MPQALRPLSGCRGEQKDGEEAMEERTRRPARRAVEKAAVSTGPTSCDVGDGYYTADALNRGVAVEEHSLEMKDERKEQESGG